MRHATVGPVDRLTDVASTVQGPLSVRRSQFDALAARLLTRARADLRRARPQRRRPRARALRRRRRPRAPGPLPDRLRGLARRGARRAARRSSCPPARAAVAGRDPLRRDARHPGPARGRRLAAEHRRRGARPALGRRRVRRVPDHLLRRGDPRGGGLAPAERDARSRSPRAASRQRISGIRAAPRQARRPRVDARRRAAGGAPGARARDAARRRPAHDPDRRRRLAGDAARARRARADRDPPRRARPRRAGAPRGRGALARARGDLDRPDLRARADRRACATRRPPAASCSGREPEDLLGRAFTDLVHPDDAAGVAAVLGAARRRPRSRRCRSPTACAAPSGAGVGRDARARGARRRRRAVVESHATVRDVAERMQSQAALAEAEERFRSAFEEAPIGMALTSPDFRFLRVNRALCQITGYTPGAARGAAGRLDHPPRRPQGRLGGARGDARGRAVEPPRRAALPARLGQRGVGR